MKPILNRIANEPALITALVLAVGNLIGQDFSGVSTFVESAIVFVAGIFVRSQVTPVRSIQP